MKRILLIFLILSLGLLAGCFPTNDVGKLTLRVPDSAYPPATVTVVASGVIGGQFTFTIEGKTYTQTGNSLTVTVNELPCEVSVIWFDGSKSQTATETIWLRNVGPIPGRLVLNFISNLWTLHAKQRYIVTYPHAYDPEGGPIKLISATVKWGTYGKLAVFCPPYTGIPPWNGIVEDYHVRLDTGQVVDNAFLFIQGWEQRIHTITLLPISPPSWGIDGYPLATTDCGPFWPTDTRPGTEVVITTKWEDEQGATTLDIQTIPANPYIGCGAVQTPSAVCP